MSQILKVKKAEDVSRILTSSPPTSRWLATFDLAMVVGVDQMIVSTDNLQSGDCISIKITTIYLPLKVDSLLLPRRQKVSQYFFDFFHWNLYQKRLFTMM